MAYVHNLYIDKGQDYRVTLEITDDSGNPVDMNGYLGENVVRKHETAVDFWNFVVVCDVDGVHMTMPKTVTANIKPGVYSHKLRITSPGGAVDYPFKGKVFVSESLNQPV